MLFQNYIAADDNDKAMELKIDRFQFNMGKIALFYDNKPTAEQLEKLFTSKNLVSYEIIINKKMFKEYIENAKKKPGQFSLQQNNYINKNYLLVLKYNFGADPEEEISLLNEVFGKYDYTFEKMLTN